MHGTRMLFCSTFLLMLLTMQRSTVLGSVNIVRPENRTITVTEGSDVVFECHLPLDESVEWFLQGQRINNDSFDEARFSIREERRDDRMTSRLTVYGINRTEAGSYKCSNADLEKALFEDNQSDSVTVKVIKINAVITIEGPRNRTVIAGQDFLLVCTGDWTSDLMWHFRGSVLQDGKLDDVISTEDSSDKSRKRSALTRHRVTADHEGEYSCYDRVNKVTARTRIDIHQSDDGNQICSSTFLAMVTSSLFLMLTFGQAF